MRISRRRIFLGAAALTATALTRRFAAYPVVAPLNTPDEGVAVTGDVLLLHDGGAAGLAFARQLHDAAQGAEVVDRAIAMLTLPGFEQAGALLESARGRTFMALLNDAETVVIDVLLKVHGAAGLDRRRYGRQALLSARL